MAPQLPLTNPYKIQVALDIHPNLGQCHDEQRMKGYSAFMRLNETLKTWPKRTRLKSRRRKAVLGGAVISSQISEMLTYFHILKILKD